MTPSLRDAAQALLDKLDGRRSFGVELLAAEFADERRALRAALATPDRALPAGDAALPVVAGNDHEVNVLRELQAIANDKDGEFWPTMVAIGALGIIGRQQANYATLERCATGLQADLVEERNRIADMRTEWAVEVAALQAEGAKSERRAIEFGDALHRHILAMRAAFVAWHSAGPAEGMAWVINTLAGPGHLPSDSDIALGAQALFDKEVAEHEAFRAAHPGPAEPAPRDTAAMLAEHKLLVTEVGAAGWACNSARLRAAELAVEASARKLLGEA